VYSRTLIGHHIEHNLAACGSDEFGQKPPEIKKKKQKQLGKNQSDYKIVASYS